MAISWNNPAVHLVRLLSVVIGALAVLFTYLIGLLIAPKHREVAVVAMILHAFWPQFLFNSSVITNDVLAATMGSIVTYCLVRLMRYGPNYLRVLTLGVAFGLALSSKFNTIVLVPIATTILIFVLIQWLHGEAYRKYTQLLGMIALYILPITACWLLSRMLYVKFPL